MTLDMPICPRCGRSDEVREDESATFWLKRKHYFCGNCEGYVFDLDEAEAED